LASAPGNTGRKFDGDAGIMGDKDAQRLLGDQETVYAACFGTDSNDPALAAFRIAKS
jgi:hypothetical protein